MRFRLIDGIGCSLHLLIEDFREAQCCCRNANQGILYGSCISAVALAAAYPYSLSCGSGHSHLLHLYDTGHLNQRIRIPIVFFGDLIANRAIIFHKCTSHQQTFINAPALLSRLCLKRSPIVKRRKSLGKIVSSSLCLKQSPNVRLYGSLGRVAFSRLC